MKIDKEKIKILLTRGVEDIIEQERLKKRLLTGGKLRVKFGLDPTGPKIHLGRATQFWKLKEFQELGHQIILIIGDFTAQIGDASDKQSMRRPLSEKEVKENMKNYIKQIGKILDIERIELHYNSEWFKKLTIKDLLNLAMKFTAQQMIQRRNFKERWETGKKIGLHELVYPLLQGYDSVMVKADLELGGADQLFNLLTGRKIQEVFNQPLQDIMTLKMLDGLDGRKMSTSWGNVVNITDSPKEMYGKLMSMHDNLIVQYFTLCTRIPLKEINQINEAMKQGDNPRNFKAQLAKEIVKLYHGPKEAEKAEREFNQIFREKKIPNLIPIFKTRIKNWPLIDLLIAAKMALSKSEARRLIKMGGVKINKKVERNWQKEVKIKKGTIVQVGPRRFVKVDFKK